MKRIVRLHIVILGLLVTPLAMPSSIKDQLNKVSIAITDNANKLGDAPKTITESIKPMVAMPQQLQDGRQKVVDAIINIYKTNQQLTTMEADIQKQMAKGGTIQKAGQITLGKDILAGITALQSALDGMAANATQAGGCSSGALCDLSKAFEDGKNLINTNLPTINEKIATLKTHLTTPKICSSINLSVINRLKFIADNLKAIASKL